MSAVLAPHFKQRLAEIREECGRAPIYIIAANFNEARRHAHALSLGTRMWRYITLHSTAAEQMHTARGIVHFTGRWHERQNLADIEQHLRYLIRTHGARKWHVVGRPFEVRV